MQISALIDHGSSGGALINEYGEVIGITSGTFYDGSQANLNYAWSIDVIKSYITMKDLHVAFINFTLIIIRVTMITIL